MEARENEVGLDLRLPWGRPDRSPATPPADAPDIGPEPTQLDGANQLGSPAVTAEDPQGRSPSASEMLQDRMDLLLLVLNGVFDRLELVEKHLGGAGQELQERFRHIEGLIRASHKATEAAVSQIARRQATSPPVDAALQVRLASLEGLLVASHQTTEELQVRLASLEGLLVASDQTKMDVTKEPSTVLARLETVGSEMYSRVDKLEWRVVSSHAALLKAINGLASSDLVTDLVQSVVATGEVLDAEVTGLKRLVATAGNSNPEPNDRPG